MREEDKHQSFSNMALMILEIHTLSISFKLLLFLSGPLNDSQTMIPRPHMSLELNDVQRDTKRKCNEEPNEE